MRAALYLLLLACVWAPGSGVEESGCGGLGSSTVDVGVVRVNPEEPMECNGELVQSWPENGATEVYIADPVSLQLSSSGGSIEVETPGVVTVITTNAEGDVVFITPTTLLTPYTKYTFGLYVCGEYTEFTFTTSQAGREISEPVVTSMLLSQAQPLDTGLMDPLLLSGGLHIDLFEQDGVFMAMASFFGSDNAQSLCIPTTAVPLVWDGKGGFIADFGDTFIDVSGVPVPVSGLSVAGILGPDGSAGGVEWQGILDERDVPAEVVSSLGGTSLCELAECLACEDGQESCVAIGGYAVGIPKQIPIVPVDDPVCE